MWSNPYPTLLMKKPGKSQKNFTKVIGFDFDSTLVNQPSGKTFPVNADDWQPLNGVVKEKLVSASKDSVIVIFTNQNGIEKNQVTTKDVMKRIDNFLNFCGLQDIVWCFAASHSDHFRKPCTGMWDFAMSQFEAANGITKINKNECLYVGDAAGRHKTKTTKKDFSCSDRTFAHNVGIAFMTPEQFFLDSPAPLASEWSWDGINPEDYLHLEKAANATAVGEKPTQELVLLIGPPASGKSTFCLKHFPNYVRINNDTLKTKAKCIKLAMESLKAGKSIIVDNTNPSAKARKEYIDCLGKTSSVPVRAIVIETPKELVFHLNNVRVKMTQGATRKIPSVCYNTYFKNFEQPKQTEGISEIVVVPFKLEFGDQKHRQLFLERT